MKLTFLGTSDGYTRTGRQHSSLLVEAAGSSMLVDAGADVAQFFHTGGQTPDHPNALYISHMHSDHTANVNALVQHLWLQKRQAPLPVYAPAGVVELMQPWLKHSLLFPGLLPFEIAWNELADGMPVKAPLGTLTPYATTHLHRLRERFAAEHPSACFDCHGFALEAEGKRLVVSTDLGAATDLLPMLQQPADILVVEMAHFSGDALLEVLRQHPVEQVWFTHYSDDFFQHVSDLQARAADAGINGQLIAATDGLVVDI